MVTALQRKLLRDVRRQGAQGLTIAVVIACGIAGYVSMRGCWISLVDSRDRYFEAYRFGDVFVHLEAAPRSVADRLADVPGVRVVEPRLAEPVRVLLDGARDPPRGWAISLPPDAVPRLDALWVQDGRPFEPGRHEEAILLRSFALAHDIQPGDPLPVLIGGRQRQLVVTGLAESPEFLYTAPPGELIPDPERFAVVWLAQDALAPLVNAEGTFDDAVLALQPGAALQPVLAGVDRLLAPYGGTGAVPRKDQPSARLLDQEMAQLRMLALVIPVVFLGVAAFLIQIVLSRIVELQRGQIATLKAFGYSRREIALHFLGMALPVGLLGTGVGLLLGTVMGRQLVAIYAEFFHLPQFAFRLDPELVVGSLLAGLVATVVGAMGTALRISAMPPAQAMQPPAPPAYTRGWAESLGLLAPLGPVARMAVRDLLRHPLRLTLSVLGIACAAASVVLGRFANDAIGDFMDVLFNQVQAEDVTVALVEPAPATAVASTLGALPGVRFVESRRVAPARFSVGHRSRDGVLLGYGEEPRLRRLLAWPARELRVPLDGIVLTDVLADRLGTGRGQQVDLEALFGPHARGTLRVTGIVSEPVGMAGHLSLETLGRLLGEQRLVNEAYLVVDDGPRTMAALQQVPGVLGATRKATVRALFDEQMGSTRDSFVYIATGFGVALALGIVYNNARIALSRRARELASLRVLGFGRREVATIVTLELGIQVLLGLPPGLWMGSQLARAILSTVSEESYRFPFAVAPLTYAFATAVVLAAAASCTVVVRRHIARLDLVGVLKTRE